ncbi:MAG: hypothetical protein ABWJ42_03940 [Sulfolobales archaeon]
MREVIENLEEMYVALEELRLAGFNTLYLLLSSSESDLRVSLILFITLNPYTEEIYGLGLMIPIKCSSDPVESASIEEIRELSARIGGYVVSFYNCSLIFKEPEESKNLKDQLLGVLRTLTNNTSLAKIRVIDYSYDLLDEIEKLPM